MKKADKILLIGYGNTLREDDGFGVAVAELLSDNFHTITNHQLLPEFCELISEQDLVIFVDANRLNDGGVFAVPLEDTHDPFNHTVSPWGLIRMTKELFGKDLKFLIFSVGGFGFEFKESLTPPLQQKAVELSEYLKNTI